MAVIATAGHVDHGKSTLVQALTGTDPDRLAEERRRGLTIELGYAWTELAGVGTVAFVDVPGHERFLATMLAGVGPVPAVLLVVAADQGWRRQTGEHVAALDALGVRHGVLALTRCDLADPAAALADSGDRLAGTSLAGIPAVAVSTRTGQGLPELRTALTELVRSLPPPPQVHRTRVFLDRVFSIRGSGTVVTATLPAGSLTVGEVLQVGGSSDRTGIRGLESCQRRLTRVDAVTRVALNLRGTGRGTLRRGDALLSPDAWHLTGEIDVALRFPDQRVSAGPSGDAVPAGAARAPLPAELILHVGAAARPARVRVLPGSDAGFARVRFSPPLPLQPGDLGVLRDPGRHAIAAGLRVHDVAPPPLVGRGAARARAAELAATEPGDLPGALRPRWLMPREQLVRRGVQVPDPLPPGVTELGAGTGWLATTAGWQQAAGSLRELVAAAVGQSGPPGLPEQAAATTVGVDDPALLDALAVRAGLTRRAGRLVLPGDTGPQVPDRLRAAVQTLREGLHVDPFAAPDAHTLTELGLDARALGALAAAGVILRLPGDIVLLPDAIDRAVAALRGLQQPFTLSTARQALGTSRRVAVPLLERLDRDGWTVRTDAALRSVRVRAGREDGSPRLA